MSLRFKINYTHFSRCFEILEVKSSTIYYRGFWKKNSLSLNDGTGQLILQGKRIEPKGIHLSWKTKYELHLLNIDQTFILKCERPLKFLWNTEVLNSKYEMNSPLPREVQIKKDNKTVFKETDRLEFFFSDNLTEHEKVATIAMYLCVLRQHEPAEMSS